jgi:uncharacterized membrane protein
MNGSPFWVLTEEDVPDSRLNVLDVVAAGRARARRRRVLASTAAAGLVALAVAGTAVAVEQRVRPTVGGLPTAPGTAGGPTGYQTVACTVERMRSPRGDEAPSVIAVDATGRYVVGAFYEGVSADPAVVLWHDGTPQVLAMGTPLYGVQAVNSAGVVAGTDTGKQRAVRYRDGQVKLLPLPPGAVATSATAVNSRGDIVGDGHFADGSWKALLWPANGASPTVLAAPLNEAHATGISDDGTVVGYLADGEQPYLWRPNGHGEPLPVPGGQRRGKAAGIQGDWAYGWAGVAAQPSTGPSGPPKKLGASVVQWSRWNVRTMQVEVLAGLAPGAVNAAGVVAGSAGGAPEPGNGGSPAIWRDGVVVTLPPVATGLGRGSATGVSADGRTVVGNVFDDAGEVPVVWHCS